MAGKHVTQFVHDMCLGVFFFEEKKGSELSWVMNTVDGIYTYLEPK